MSHESHEQKTKTVDEELAEAERELATLEEQREAEAKAHALEIAKLRLKYAKELGKEGYAFAIVETGEGVVVVERVSAIVSKRFRDSISGDKENTPQKSLEYTAPGVLVPDAATYKAWCARNDFVAITVANALTGLYLAEGEMRRGKR
jgi:hypothetical protein